MADSILTFSQNVHVESAKGEIDAFEEAENELKKIEKDLQSAEAVPLLFSTWRFFLLGLHVECKLDSVSGENPLREHNEKQGPTWY